MNFDRKYFYLYNVLPLMYGEDSVTVEIILKQAGYTEITPANIDNAIGHCTSQLESRLWLENLDKQAGQK